MTKREKDNCIRINNDVIVFEEGRGLDLNNIDWLPGEVSIIKKGEIPPAIRIDFREMT